jgi:purine-binding chemotaxis protein CheW
VSEIHVRCRVGVESYALPVENVLEVSELGEVGVIPGCGPAVLGLLNLRGRVLPAFDLARVLGIPREGSPSRLVVAELDGRMAGLAIDEVTDVGPLPGAVEETEVQYLARTALHDGELIGVIDVERLFAALEPEATA